MDTVQRTKQVLAEAEKALASLASEAATKCRYDTAACLIDSARELSNLAATVVRKLTQCSDGGTTTAGNQAADGTPMARTAPLSGNKVSKGKYPRFLRQGNDLVKIGWSPTEKAEYEHKCPRKVLPHLASAIAKVGANGKRFTMDGVLPLHDSADGSRIPDYQAYLCLAWLREVGCVIQHGRQGYSLPTSKSPMETLIETYWINLPAR